MHVSYLGGDFIHIKPARLDPGRWEQINFKLI